MFKLLADLRQFVKSPPVTIDCFTFRVHVTFTTVLLFFCSIIVTTSQFVGTPIQCIVDRLPPKPVNSFCWIMSTYTMPDAFQREQLGIHYAHPGVGPENPGEPRKYVAYYQWVCFALFFQGILCYLPKWIWEMQEGGLMNSLVMNLHIGRLDAEKERASQKKIVVNYLLTHIRQHTWYVAKYWFCEFLCLANIVLQIYGMNKFFGGEFVTYGLRVIGMSGEHQDDRIDPMVYIFPRVTKCEFHKFGPSGTIQNHDSLCVLPLNIVNEKIYIVIWFWYLIMLSVLVLTIGYRILIKYNKNVRVRVLQIHNNCGLITEDLARAVTKKVSLGDWWVLYMLGKNIDPVTYWEVMREIAKNADN